VQITKHREGGRRKLTVRRHRKLVMERSVAWARLRNGVKLCSPEDRTHNVDSASQSLMGSALGSHDLGAHGVAKVTVRNRVASHEGIPLLGSHVQEIHIVDNAIELPHTISKRNRHFSKIEKFVL
jgi:hypothetical protein